MFGEYEEYENTTKTGIDILNTAKKYRNNDLVEIKVNGTTINKENYINSYSNESAQVILGNQLYNTTVDINNNTGKVVISFTK